MKKTELAVLVTALLAEHGMRGAELRGTSQGMLSLIDTYVDDLSRPDPEAWMEQNLAGYFDHEACTWHKIKAIKDLKMVTGIGLKEAKDFIEDGIRNIDLARLREKLIGSDYPEPLD